MPVRRRFARASWNPAGAPDPRTFRPDVVDAALARRYRPNGSARNNSISTSLSLSLGISSLPRAC